MAFEGVLLIIAEIGFVIFLFLLLIRWLFVLPYLWFKYDKPILNLKRDLDIFREKESKNPNISQGLLEKRIEYKKREVDNQLDILETKRRLFLERVNLLLSIISVDKK